MQVKKKHTKKKNTMYRNRPRISHVRYLQRGEAGRGAYSHRGLADGSAGPSVEVAVGEDHGGHQGPHVQGHADPAGRHLHPNRRPFARHGLVAGVRAEADEGEGTLRYVTFYSDAFIQSSANQGRIATERAR